MPSAPTHTTRGDGLLDDARDLERVQASGPKDSKNKSLYLGCPPDKRILGVGVNIEGAEGEVVLEDIHPGVDLRSVSIDAFEDETGATRTWRLQGYARCAKPPPASS
jgi:hypothetical protein